MDTSKDELMVTIRCLAYNHEPYIRQCLDGFVMQKTNFRFEAIVHDDASTDGTAAIIKEYAEKYPDIIKPIFETENQYSKRDGSIRRIMNEHTHGKYVALCEGDDYWIDPLKLQKQFDFMESHPNHSLCFHAYCKLFNDGCHKEKYQFSKDIIDVPKENMILGGGGYMATNSMFFIRKVYDNYPNWVCEAPVGDCPLMLLLLEYGKVAYLNDNMSVYRVFSAGSWSSKTSKKITKRYKHHIAVIRMWRNFDKWSNLKYHNIVEKRIYMRRKHFLFILLKNIIGR